jgi:hypothetical protein
MGLKGEREVLATNIYFTATASKDMERGIVLVANGTAADIGVLPQHPLTHKPIGLLMDDVENLDFTTRPQIFVRNVVPQGSEITLLTKGRVKTDMISASTVAAGEKAYLDTLGKVTNVVGSGLEVGHFESEKDADGYARLWVDIVGA